MSTSSASADFVAKLPGYVFRGFYTHTDSLAHTTYSVLAAGAFSDVTHICGGKVFKVHKIILCTQSEVFCKALDGDSKVGR